MLNEEFSRFVYLYSQCRYTDLSHIDLDKSQCHRVEVKDRALCNCSSAWYDSNAFNAIYTLSIYKPGT